MGWLQKTPVVSLLFALAMAAMPFVLDGSVPFVLDEEPAAEADPFTSARDAARSYLMRNPRLEVDPLGELILDPAWIAQARAISADSPSLEIQLPARMMARSQAKLDELVALAYEARLAADPAWRLGVLDASSPPRNYVAHAFVHETMAGVILCCLVLLLAGAPLERVWGSPVYAALVLSAVPASAWAYRLLDGTSGVPWSGGAGLAAALVGAYFIRGLSGDFVLPGWILLPAWLATEAFVVRGFWLDDLGGVPWATICAAIGFGAASAGALQLLNVEARLPARRAHVGPNPVIARAARLRSDGDPYQAFDLIQAAWRDDPDDDELREAFFDIAVEVDQPEAAADAIVPLLRKSLRAGEVSRAVDYWYPLAARECDVVLEPTVSIRLGEALLDAGHPEQALFSLRGALDAGLSSAHATRIVGIARDLDPGLARRAATIALADPALEPVVRADLEPIVAEGEAAPPTADPAPAPPSESQLDRRVSAEHQVVETTAFPIALDDDIETGVTGPGEHEAALTDQALDPGALSAEHLAKDTAPVVGSDAHDAQGGSDVLSHWNDSAVAGGDTIDVLGAALDEPDLGEALFAADDLESPYDDFDFGTDVPELEPLGDSDSDMTPMMDASDSTGEVTSPMSGETRTVHLEAAAAAHPDEAATQFHAAHPDEAATQFHATHPDEAATQFHATHPDEAATQFHAVEPGQAATQLQPTPEAGTETQLVTLREIKAIEAVPVHATDEWIEIDAQGRGKSKLPLNRLQAISIAAIEDLGPRPVLVLDLVLNWAATTEPMKLIRVRSDRFDPLAFVPEAGSPLAALTAWIASLEATSQATCLPGQAILEGRFLRFATISDYERDVLIGRAAD